MHVAIRRYGVCKQLGESCRTSRALESFAALADNELVSRIVRDLLYVEFHRQPRSLHLILLLLGVLLLLLLQQLLLLLLLLLQLLLLLLLLLPSDKTCVCKLMEWEW
jgi:hypothetical protein